MPPVLVVHDRPELFLDRLQGRFPDLEFVTATGDEPVADVLDRTGPEVVFAFKCTHYADPVHAPILNYPSVRWLHNAGAGVDHLPPWDRAHVTVTNGAGTLSRFMAETVIGAMIMLNFGFPRYLANQRERIWAQHSWTSLEGKTLLIIGLGRIGAQIAARAREFGMRVVGARRSATPSDAVDEMVGIDGVEDVLETADFVSIHVPNTPQTRHLVNDGFLARMKPTAHLINTSRGAQVDETALVAALEAGGIAGAYLDVFSVEPLPPDSPLWTAPNLVMSPHMSDSVDDWEALQAEFFADNLKRRLAGEALENVVDPTRGY